MWDILLEGLEIITLVLAVAVGITGTYFKKFSLLTCVANTIYLSALKTYCFRKCSAEVTYGAILPDILNDVEGDNQLPVCSFLLTAASTSSFVFLKKT